MNLIKIIGFYSGRYSSSATSAAGATTDSVQPRKCGTGSTSTNVSVWLRVEPLCLGLNLSSMVAMTLYAADAGTVKPYFSWHSFLRYEICVDLGMLSRYFLTSGIWACCPGTS